MNQNEFNEEVLNLIKSLTEKTQKLQTQVNEAVVKIEYLQNRANQLDSFH